MTAGVGAVWVRLTVDEARRLHDAMDNDQPGWLRLLKLRRVGAAAAARLYVALHERQVRNLL